VLDRSEGACRQLASRGRAHVSEERPRFRPSEDDVTRLTDAFHRAVLSGDAAQFADLLAQDAVLYSDGGGKRIAALNPIVGRDKILRFFAGIADKNGIPAPETIHRIPLNGMPGFLLISADGIDTIALGIRDGRIAAIYAVRNPDKLQHLVRFTRQDRSFPAGGDA